MNFPYCTYSKLYIGCSGPVIRSSIAYFKSIFRTSTTGTMSLTTQILRIAAQLCNKQKYAKLSIPSLIRILHYVMSLILKGDSSPNDKYVLLERAL